MNATRIFVFVCLLVSSVANGATSFVFGKALSEDDDVEIKLTAEEVCPPDAICLFGWSRWTLKIQRSFAGPNINGRIHAVHWQHTTHNRAYFKALHLFALEHIEDPAERARLHAEYKMDLVDERKMISTDTDPKVVGIARSEIYSATSDDSYKFCFTDPDKRH